MTLNQIIKLRRHLQLPETPTAEARIISGELLQSSEDPATAEYFQLFLDIFDVRFGSKGIIAAAEGLGDLLRISTGKFKSRPEFSRQMDEAVKLYTERVQSAPERFGGQPAQYNNIKIYYLSSRRAQIKQLADGDLRWDRLCLVGYLTLGLGIESSVKTQREWAVKHQVPGSSQAVGADEIRHFAPRTDKQAQENACAVGKVLCSIRLKTVKTKTPLFIKSKAVKKALKIANREKSFKTKLSDYIRLAQPLFLGNEVNRARLKLPSAHTPQKRNSPDKRPVLGVQQLEKSEKEIEELFRRFEHRPEPTRRDVFRGAAIKTYKEKVKIEIEEGAAADEFQPALPQSQILDYRAYLIEGYRRRRLLGWNPVWDKRFITQEQMGVIISYLFSEFQKLSQPADYLQALTFAMIQVSFGFADGYLIGAQIQSEVNIRSINRDSPLIYSNGCFYIHPKKRDGQMVFGAPDIKLSSPCLPGSHCLAVMVPELLRRLIEHNISFVPPFFNDLFFRFTTGSQSAAEAILKLSKYLPDAQDLLNRKVDFRRIGASASKHLVHAGGLDALLANFISSEVGRNHGAKGNYVNQSMASLNSLFETANQKSWSRLLAASESLINDLGLLPLAELEHFVSSKGKCDLADAQNLLFGRERYGSPFVPVVDSLREYLNDLKTAIATALDPILRFNCQTALAILSLMLVTALRPMEIESLERNNICDFGNLHALLSVGGKSNLYFDEWRVANLTRAFKKIITDYDAACENVFGHLIRQGSVYGAQITAQRAGRLFFFVRPNGAIVQATTDELSKQLREVMPRLHEIPAFAWKLNGTRHLFATTALELQTSRTETDALLGHTTRGLEPLSRFSLLFYDELAGAAEKVSSHLARLLGIEICETEVPPPLLGDTVIQEPPFNATDSGQGRQTLAVRDLCLQPPGDSRLSWAEFHDLYEKLANTTESTGPAGDSQLIDRTCKLMFFLLVDGAAICPKPIKRIEEMLIDAPAALNGYIRWSPKPADNSGILLGDEKVAGPRQFLHQMGRCHLLSYLRFRFERMNAKSGGLLVPELTKEMITEAKREIPELRKEGGLLTWTEIFEAWVGNKLSSNNKSKKIKSSDLINCALVRLYTKEPPLLLENRRGKIIAAPLEDDQFKQFLPSEFAPKTRGRKKPRPTPLEQNITGIEEIEEHYVHAPTLVGADENKAARDASVSKIREFLNILYDQRLPYPKAVTLAEQLKANKLFDLPQTKDVSLLLDWLIGKLKKGNKKRNRASTIFSEGKRLLHIFDFYPFKSFNELTLEDYAYFLAQYPKANTANNYLNITVRFHNFIKYELKVNVPEIDWKSPFLRFRKHYRERRLLTGAQFQTLIDNASFSTVLNEKQMQIVLLLMRRAGLRCGELADLKVGNFAGMTEGYFIVKLSKSDAGRRILPLHLLLDDSELEMVKTFINSLKAAGLNRHQFLNSPLLTGKDNQPLSASRIGDEVKKVLRANGFDRQTAHDLRHGFGSGLVAALWLKETSARGLIYSVDHKKLWARNALEQFGRAGVEGRALTFADDIRKLMGHSGIEVTFQQYVHVLDLVTADAVRLSENSSERVFLTAQAAAHLVGVSDRAVRSKFDSNHRKKNKSRRSEIEMIKIEEWLAERLRKYV